MLLLVDVVNNDSVVPFDHLCILYALVDPSMALKDLEDSLLIHVFLVLAQEGAEGDQLSLVLVVEV